MNKKSLFLCMFMYSIAFASQQTTQPTKRTAIVRPMCQRQHNALGTSGFILGMYVEKRPDDTYSVWHKMPIPGKKPEKCTKYTQMFLAGAWEASGADHETTLEVPATPRS